MKRTLFLISTLILLVACGGGSSRSNSEESGFRMHLRLWPAHHNDHELRDELIDALVKYKGLFDDAWLCMETATIVMDEHRASAENMAIAATKLRAIGVEPSIQGISVGHSDSFELQSSQFNPTEWGAAKGIFGNQCSGIHCPRQEGFLNYISEAYELYARECKPRVVWIDDDLRLTNHPPARAICYCDDCIAEFNALYDGHWTRETLVAALDSEQGDHPIRRQWIAFSRQSLAMVGAAIARGVHHGSPDSKVGLQHTGFHRELLEGYDWNPILDSIEVVTGQPATSRPGHGFYNDHAPRGMIEKGYDIARQVHRLNPNIQEIACEIEGYMHWATGKSPHGLCVESLLYLAAGSTQLSYAIICSAVEPMEWYADNYFKALARWRKMYEEYAACNAGTRLGGVDPYISPDMVMRHAPDFNWITAERAGDVATSIAPLGVPYAPDSDAAVAYVVDAPSAWGIPTQEFEELLSAQGVVFDNASWEVVKLRQLDHLFTPAESTGELGTTMCYSGKGGGRAAVIPAFNQSISNAKRLEILKAIDWASNHRLPVIVESMAQVIVMPRVDAEGTLRSIMLLNCSISEQMQPTRLRLRGCDLDGKSKLVWHSVGGRNKVLQAQREGDDVMVDIPPLAGWYAGWLSIK
jgi:hypothetical protein